MVGANEPMPSVSKKLVAAPTATASPRGFSARRAIAVRTSSQAWTIATSTSVTSKTVSMSFPPKYRLTACAVTAKGGSSQVTQLPADEPAPPFRLDSSPKNQANHG